MIEIDENVVMTFGTGDINVTSGYMNEDEKVVLVCFNNQEPREIGSVGKIPVGTELYVESFDVVMKFDKKESIDVVIRALQTAKENLERCDNNDRD